MAPADDEKTVGLFEKLKEIFGQLVPDAQTVEEAFKNMTYAADDLNKAFTESRERIVEMMAVVADAKPAFARLGGEITDVVSTITEIAAATRKNVLASTEDATKLFAASKLIDTSVTEVVTRFADVGVSFTQAGKQMENSINYVRSIGANTKEVMSVVLSQMDNMNRFNFQNGVEGVTRMAAQASTLRFNMQTTLDLADQALKPERAVELAGAFQRLGLAVGDLGDPFGLMSKSLMDPEGLQKNLVEMSKQFASFDERTKSFKISPEGMLRMRELQDQTGLSAREMSKMALSALELDKKLSALKPSITFANEEDKQYLMNIAKMGEGGTYEVTLQDGTKKELAELTQPELDKLIEQQKVAPKTTEEILRDGLRMDEAMITELKGIRNQLEYGFVSASAFRRNIEGVRRAGTGITSTLRQEMPTSSEVRREIDSLFGKIGEAFKGFGKVTNREETNQALADLEKQIGGYEGVIGTKLGNILEKMQKSTGGSEFEQLMNSAFKEIGNIRTELQKTTTDATRTSGTKAAMASPASLDKPSPSSPQVREINQNLTGSLTVNGGQPIKVSVETPPGVSAQYLTNLLQSQAFADNITKIVSDKLKENGYKPLIVNNG